MTDGAAISQVLVWRSPVEGLVVSVVLLVAGYVMLRYRDEIGGATGYWLRWHLVDKPTPGCLLVPFAILLMLVGAAGLTVALVELLSPHRP